MTPSYPGGIVYPYFQPVNYANQFQAVNPSITSSWQYPSSQPPVPPLQQPQIAAYGMQPQQPVPYITLQQHFPSSFQYTDEGPDDYESDTTSEESDDYTDEDSDDCTDEESDDYTDEEPSLVPPRQQPQPQMVYGASPWMPQCLQQYPPTYLQDYTTTQCGLPGCSRPVYVDPANGRVHRFCCRVHAYKTHRKGVISADHQCQTPGCPRPKRKKDDGSGFFDYRSIYCRNNGQTSASVPKDLALQERGPCNLPGCNRPKYVDPANGRVHDFCGRTHASEAHQRGISVDVVSVRVANSGEFQAISVKFKKDWVKGQCPNVSSVFIITNTPLGKRYDAYRKKLSDQTREHHYHGTKLKCNIMKDQRTCNDSDCGVCGISSMGLDRRCIQKNISFQRFGHGFYLAPNSSKCHDYTQGAHNFRAMLLCEVAPGRKYFLQKNDTSLKGPPQGFDSVYGKGAAGSASVLNYDEIVIYNPDSVLPRYIIIYQKDGTRKIAH